MAGLIYRVEWGTVWGYGYENIKATEGTMNDFLNITLSAMREYASQFKQPDISEDVETDLEKDLPDEEFNNIANASYSLFPILTKKYKADMVSFQHGFEIGYKYKNRELAHKPTVDEDVVRMLSSTCVNSKHIAYWLAEEDQECCQCVVGCRVRIIYRGYEYIVTKEEYLKLKNNS